MIRHVVMFKLKPGVSPAQRDEWLEMSRRLHDEIDPVRAYADHPAHLPAVELSRKLSEHIVSVDFEI